MITTFCQAACPKCQGPVTVAYLGRLGKFVGHHQSNRYGQFCEWSMGTWQSFSTIDELEAAIGTVPPRVSSPEHRENVTAVISSLVGRHSASNRLRKEVLELMRRVEALNAA